MKRPLKELTDELGSAYIAKDNLALSILRYTGNMGEYNRLRQLANKRISLAIEAIKDNGYSITRPRNHFARRKRLSS